jgi:hypothetical protein
VGQPWKSSHRNFLGATDPPSRPKPQWRHDRCGRNRRANNRGAPAQTKPDVANALRRASTRAGCELVPMSAEHAACRRLASSPGCAGGRIAFAVRVDQQPRGLPTARVERRITGLRRCLLATLVLASANAVQPANAGAPRLYDVTTAHGVAAGAPVKPTDTFARRTGRSTSGTGVTHAGLER